MRDKGKRRGKRGQSSPSALREEKANHWRNSTGMQETWPQGMPEEEKRKEKSPEELSSRNCEWKRNTMLDKRRPSPLYPRVILIARWWWGGWGWSSKQKDPEIKRLDRNKATRISKWNRTFNAREKKKMKIEILFIAACSTQTRTQNRKEKEIRTQEGCEYSPSCPHEERHSLYAAMLTLSYPGDQKGCKRRREDPEIPHETQFNVQMHAELSSWKCSILILSRNFTQTTTEQLTQDHPDWK